MLEFAIGWFVMTTAFTAAMGALQTSAASGDLTGARRDELAAQSDYDAFRDLERGQFMALGPALSRRPLGLRIGPTDTQPRNATPRLMPLPSAVIAAHCGAPAEVPPTSCHLPARYTG